MIRIQQLKLPVGHSEDALLKKAANTLGISRHQIQSFKIIRQSLDARHKPELFFVYTVDIDISKGVHLSAKIYHKNIMKTNPIIYRFPDPGNIPLKHRPIVVGSGPAGLFCAYMLAKYGYRPLIIERGEEASKRKQTVDTFWKTGTLDTTSNVQFGEGGAGTFSDGKLNTTVKDSSGRNQKVLELLVEAGAPADILYQQKPHLGTDLLINVVQTIRRQIMDMGGEFRFSCQMSGLTITDNRLTQVTCNQTLHEPVQVLVCAIGHSARDTFHMLYESGLAMVPKSFAVGVRIEHPQKLINLAQYGSEAIDGLGAASYKLTHQLSNGRGIYSFCMCPGGYVVNASSEQKALAVNGMSYHGRNSANANSAVIVTVTPQDYAACAGEKMPAVLSGVAFQRRLEQAAYNLEKGKVPVQLWQDFINRRQSSELGSLTPCIKGAWQLSALHECLPAYIYDSLREGITAFDDKIPGFASADCLLSAVESRTSSPVRMLRNEFFESNIHGFYPCGEGAGYAGGITSAAIDGLKTAEAIRRKYKNLD